MERKHLAILILLFAVVVVVGKYLTGYFTLVPKAELGKCEIDKMTYYYAEWCGWCKRIANERTIQKLEDLGVNVTKINVVEGPIKHEFTGVPTFVIDEKIYSGYRTFEQLKELLGCEA
jgi:thiol-disulfide isomerase/thioredoxin